jgi:orotidine-5'-phosphate decarboxylase
MPTELIVGLDLDTRDQALEAVQACDECMWFKIGSQLFTRCGPDIVHAVRDRGKDVFLDLKFHDIPNTVAGAVSAAARHGVDILDVHASGGTEMMKSAAEAARASKKKPLVFAVTILTHLGDGDLERLGFREGSRGQVARLAALAAESGLDGVVASAWEVDAIRAAAGDALRILVPGVRPEWAKAGHDQKRIATPGEVARSGASYAVVGRAITLAPSPRDAAKRILEEISIR